MRASALAVHALLTDSPEAWRAVDHALDITSIRAGLRLTDADIREAQFDGFVHCDECGHRLEDHQDQPCPGELCGCPVVLTGQQIGDLREAYSLPRGEEE